jgi:hypothetical protein
MYLTNNLTNSQHLLYLKYSNGFIHELFSIIKASIYYLYQQYLNNETNNDINKDESLQLIELLKTYCILYKSPDYFINKFENNTEDDQLDKKSSLVLYQTNNTNNTNNTNVVSNIVNIDDNSLFEFWATFTSCWHIFVKHNLEGLYLLFITFRTFDENNLIISKDTCSIINKTLLTLYPFNKEELLDIVTFFNSTTKYKSDIKSVKECNTDLLLK